MALIFKNVSPLGRLEIPALRGEPIDRGEEFEVPEHLGEQFAAQPDNFEPVSADAVALVAAPADDEPAAAGDPEGGEV